MTNVAQLLLTNFGRMVARDGGILRLLDQDVGGIRLGYAPGHDPECESGACILPHVELQDMIQEWAARAAPGVAVTVQLIGKAQAQDI
jgi:hypothetical protein